jgi:hypothetical protein
MRIESYVSIVAVGLLVLSSGGCSVSNDIATAPKKKSPPTSPPVVKVVPVKAAPVVQETDVNNEAALLGGAAVSLSLPENAKCQVRAMVQGTPLYLDRKYICKQLPEELAGLKFVAFPVLNAVTFEITVQKDGPVWLFVTPKTDLKALNSGGWETTDMTFDVNFDMGKAIVLKRDGVKGDTYKVAGNVWINPMIAAESIALESDNR